MSARLSAAERGELAERMVPLAHRLIQTVHGDGGPREVGRLLARVRDEDGWRALAVTLAAMARPGMTARQLLAWVTWDEEGRPLPAAEVLANTEVPTTGRVCPDCGLVLPPRKRVCARCGTDAGEAASTQGRAA